MRDFGFFWLPLCYRNFLLPQLRPRHCVPHASQGCAAFDTERAEAKGSVVGHIHKCYHWLRIASNKKAKSRLLVHYNRVKSSTWNNSENKGHNSRQSPSSSTSGCFTPLGSLILESTEKGTYRQVATAAAALPTKSLL